VIISQSNALPNLQEKISVVSGDPVRRVWYFWSFSEQSRCGNVLVCFVEFIGLLLPIHPPEPHKSIHKRFIAINSDSNSQYVSRPDD
jgi:hypothetical protein